MEQVDGGGAVDEFFDALATGDLHTILTRSSPRLLSTVWGSGSEPTRLPRAGLGGWFAARDALTDAGVETRVLGTIERTGTTVALLVHAFERQGCPHTYETVDRVTFRSGLAVAWFSRPVDGRHYAEAWGLRSPELVETLRGGLDPWRVAESDLDPAQDGL